MTREPTTSSELIVYKVEDRRTRIECRFESELSGTHAERPASEVG